MPRTSMLGPSLPLLILQYNPTMSDDFAIDDQFGQHAYIRPKQNAAYIDILPWMVDQGFM